MFYVLATIGFLVLVFFFQKFNQGVLNTQVKNAEAQSNLPQLAQLLGLKLEDYSLADGNKTIMSTGKRLSGIYHGRPLEIILASATSNTSYGLTTQFTTTSQKQIAFKIQNPKNLDFQITPKSQALATPPTPSKTFNEHLSLIGQASIPNDFLDMCGAMGWMHLAVKGKDFIVIDDFYDRLSRTSPLKMLSVIHPIWGSAAKTGGQFDLAKTKQFIDKISEVISTMGL